METPDIKKISCVAAVYSAWDKMENLLFRPFDLQKWFLLGFAAWLANLGKGGFGSGFSLPQNPNFPKAGAGQGGAGNPFGAFRDLFHSEIFSTALIVLICAVVLMVIVIAIAIAIVFLWVRSRGAFVFVYDLVTGTTLLRHPWDKYSRQGNSLFLLRIVVGILVFLSMMLCIGLAILMLYHSIANSKLDAMGIGGIIFGVMSLLLLVLAAVMIELSIEGFIIPIMYGKMVSSWDALYDFASLVNHHPAAFIRYYLMYFLLSVCATTAVAVFILSTCCFCCIGLIILSLPYIWAVAMLPILVFFRYYSIDFLGQFGQEYRIMP